MARATKKDQPEAAAVWVSVEDLNPWERNPRRNDHAVEEVAASIRRFGFGAPIVARKADGMVIAGHTRLKAAQHLGLDKVPVRYLDLDPTEAQPLAIADNKVGEIAEWDEAELAALLRDLDVGEATEGLGFDEEDLKDLLDSIKEPTPEPSDDAPEVQEGEPDSNVGEVYELGPHRLLCGDCMSDEASAFAADADAVVTDPPYGTGIRAPKGLGASAVPMELVGDEDTTLAEAAVRRWWTNKPQLWWGANYYSHAVPGAPCWLVWDKGRRGMTFADCEIAATSHRGPARIFEHMWNGGARDSERGVTREHPTQKPIALLRWCIQALPDECNTIADPFGGSGTTLIAAAAEGRVALLIEIDPKCCDVIRRRWTAYAREAGIDPGPGALEPVVGP